MIEALQARRIEMTWSKERILAEYLNRVGYGNLLTGCASAARGYFDKPLRDLSPAECAFLAALPQAPSRLNPFKNLQAAQARQKFVLDGMVERGWLTAEKRKLAADERVVLHRFNGGFEAPHAIELAWGTGLQPGPQVVRTTILPALQSRMESIISRRLAALRDRHVTQAAAVVIENKTGRVLALAGAKSTKDAPIWFMVDIAFVARFAAVVPLETLKATPGLEKMMVTQKGSRLSVQPVTRAEYDIVVQAWAPEAVSTRAWGRRQGARQCDGHCPRRRAGPRCRGRRRPFIGRRRGGVSLQLHESSQRHRRRDDDVDASRLPCRGRS